MVPLPMMVEGEGVGGGVGGETFKKETNRIDFLESVPTWVFFPLKT